MQKTVISMADLIVIKLKQLMEEMKIDNATNWLTPETEK